MALRVQLQLSMRNRVGAFFGPLLEEEEVSPECRILRCTKMHRSKFVKF